MFYFAFSDDDYMQSEAVVITILAKNSIDHNSAEVLMARAWEAEFIQTVLAWRQAHPDIIVSFAAEVRRRRRHRPTPLVNITWGRNKLHS